MKYQISLKSVQLEPCCPCPRMDGRASGQTYRHGQAWRNSNWFSQFYKRT